MPNEYSIEIHNFLSEKIASVEKKLRGNDNDSEYCKGMLMELNWLREYLKDNIDLKDFKYY